MKRRYISIGLIVFLGILFLCIASACADGWEKNGDHLMYMDGETALTGPQTIDGSVYYFSDEGYLEGNGKVQHIDGEYYYINSSNNLLYRWQTVKGKKYYFDQATGKALRTCDMYSWEQDWVSEYNDGRPGWVTYASWKINGNWYVFNRTGSLVINSWCEGYYGNNEGKILTGYKKVGDSYYYFNEYGESQDGFIKINGSIHYFVNNWCNGCPEARGWEKTNSDWYYFDESTGIMRTGLLSVKGHQYYLNNDGTLEIKGKSVLYDSDSIIGIDKNGNYLNGWQVISGNTYYFTDYDYDGQALTGLNDIYVADSGLYYFAADGVMQKEELIKENGEYYYFGADGRAITGWKKIDGSTYYFDDGDYYALTGLEWLMKNGERNCYYFSKTGKMQTSKLITNEGLKYYFGKSGKAITGWKKINGSTYYFDDWDCYALTGLEWLVKDGEKNYYYFSESGKMKTNKLITAEGSMYYFGKDGKAITGWKTISGYTYYFSPRAYIDGTFFIERDGEYHDFTFNSKGRLVAVDGQKLTDLKKADVSIKNQVYTGQAIKPDLTVKVKGKKLKLKKDYTVKWQNNTEIGEATVTLTGKGIYYGTTTATFKIIPQSVKLSSLKAGNKQLTVKWKKGSNIEGYVIEYSLKKNFSNAKKVIIPKAKTNTTKIKKLKNGKTYYVRIRTFKEVGGKNYYSKWSNVLSEEVGK